MAPDFLILNGVQEYLEFGMPLKAFVTDISTVPESLRTEYTQVDGGYALQVDDRDYKNKIDEFRSNNVQARKRAEDLEATMKKYEGIDPEKWTEAQEALGKLRALEEKQMIQAGDLDKVLAQRTETMRKDYDQLVNKQRQTIEQTTGQLGTYKNKLGTLLIDQAVQNAVMQSAQPRQGALPDIINRARGVWSVDDDGNLTGKGLFNDKAEPMSINEWAQRLVTEAPFLFEGGQGGGSPGGRPTTKATQKTATVDRNDPVAFGKNLEAIAAGAVEVG